MADKGLWNIAKQSMLEDRGVLLEDDNQLREDVEREKAEWRG